MKKIPTSAEAGDPKSELSFFRYLEQSKWLDLDSLNPHFEFLAEYNVSELLGNHRVSLEQLLAVQSLETATTDFVYGRIGASCRTFHELLVRLPCESGATGGWGNQKWGPALTAISSADRLLYSHAVAHVITTNQKHVESGQNVDHHRLQVKEAVARLKIYLDTGVAPSGMRSLVS